MNWVDLAVLVLVAISAALAFMRGFVRETLGIVAWAGAGYFSYIGIDYVRFAVRDMMGNPEMADIVSHAGLFLAGLLILSVATSVIARSLARRSPVRRSKSRWSMAMAPNWRA